MASHPQPFSEIIRLLEFVMYPLSMIKLDIWRVSLRNKSKLNKRMTWTLR